MWGGVEVQLEGIHERRDHRRSHKAKEGESIESLPKEASGSASAVTSSMLSIRVLSRALLTHSLLWLGQPATWHSLYISLGQQGTSF